jgi:hypothetical protein
MVHALEEIRRVLIPAGLLIDLRPLADSWPVEVVWSGGSRQTGHLTDMPAGLSDDATANHAMEEAARVGWFVRENEMVFPAFEYWDDPEEMRFHMLEKWGDFTTLEEESLRATRAAWAAAGDDKRVRVKLKMLLTVWKKGLLHDRVNGLPG